MRKYLLTCETIGNYKAAAERLGALPKRMMLRVPIQWDDQKGQVEDPRAYADAFDALSQVADLMIEFVDSSAMKHFSARSYERHVNDCLDALGRFCKAAEAGNEVNGNWLGRNTASKVRRALAACEKRGITTAVTYYLSADDPGQMFEWIRKNPLRSDYALISYYPNTTPGSQIDPGEIYSKFAEAFHGLPVGWGEYGTQDADGKNTAPLPDRAALVRKIEKEYWELLAPAFANYAGFGGYWDWETDAGLDAVFNEVWS